MGLVNCITVLSLFLKTISYDKYNGQLIAAEPVSQCNKSVWTSTPCIVVNIPKSGPNHIDHTSELLFIETI